MDSSVEREVIICFGFITGVLLAIGISSELERFLSPMINQVNILIEIGLIIVPIIFICAIIYTVYRTSRKAISLAAIIIAFIGGIIIIRSPQMSLLLLIFSIVIGYVT